jgi:hypothetical protein
MRVSRYLALFSASAWLVAAGPSAAQEFSGSSENPGLFSIFDEVRTGGAFSVQPDLDSGFILRGELLFRSFLPPQGSYLGDTLLRPRVHVGGSLATGGDDQISQVYAGLTWNFPIVSNLFLEGSFGFTAHDGPLDDHPGGPNLGCTILFRESLGLGVDLGQHWRALVAADHSSHAHLICDGRNAGITHVGAYVGYRF